MKSSTQTNTTNPGDGANAKAGKQGKAEPTQVSTNAPKRVQVDPNVSIDENKPQKKRQPQSSADAAAKDVRGAATVSVQSKSDSQNSEGKNAKKKAAKPATTETAATSEAGVATPDRTATTESTTESPKPLAEEGVAADCRVADEDDVDDTTVPATAVSWSESQLPTLFGCHNTAAAATTIPIALNTVWELYADDHTGTTNTRVGSQSVSMMSPQQQQQQQQAAGAVNFDPVFIASVANVESFWRLWRFTPPPSACTIPFTYSWFRRDIKPEWEHPRNKKGGTISFVVFDRDRPGLNSKIVLDDVFMATLLGAIGESFNECNNTLNGIILKLRQNKPVTLQMWTAHSDVVKLKAFASSVRDTLSKIIGPKTLQKLEYYSHHQKYAANNALANRAKPKLKQTPDHVF